MKKIFEGNIVISSGVQRLQVEYDASDFVITRVGKRLGSPNFSFGDSCLVFPSFIDIHTHCREDHSKSSTHKENFKTASMAAINGGVCAIGDMPNNSIPPIDDESYLVKKQLAESSRIPVILYGAINSKSSPIKENVPYKYFMGPTTGVGGSDNSKVLDRYRGKCVSFHCEDPEFFVDSSFHHYARPVISEVVAIRKAIKLIEQYELEGIICHVSSRDGFVECLKAKRRGVNLKIEVSPHHLLFNFEDSGTASTFKVNPPIRRRDEQRYLLSQLKRGNVDYIGSDHAPHLINEKAKGLSGIPGLDTFALVMGKLIKDHNISPEIILKCCATNPGNWASRFLNIKVGKIEKGYLASFTLLDFSETHTVTFDTLRTKCSWSPFENKQFPLSTRTFGRFESERFDLN